MRSASIRSTILVLFVGVALGLAAGYLVGRALAQSPAASAPNHSAELAQLRAEVDELKSQMAPASVDEQVTQLQGMVADILLRGDEFSLRADYARTADRLDGHKPSDFALRDADGDGTDDLEQVKQTLAAIVSGATPVGKAKKADSAGNAEFLGNLALTDFAVANHSHAKLGDVRVDGALSVTGNTIASGDMQVFGEVVAVGGLMPGSANTDPKPAIAGLIRYNRRTGALEYCDGTRWNEIAVVSQP